MAFEELVSYKPGEKGLGEIAADILTKASRATDDAEMQHKLGLKAFLKAVPEGIGRELHRKHFNTVRQALEEAKFLQKIEAEEAVGGNKVLALNQEREAVPAQDELVEKLIQQLKEKGLVLGETGQPGQKRQPKTNQANSVGALQCWCCGELGHGVMECPIVLQNRSAQKGTGRGKSAENE